MITWNDLTAEARESLKQIADGKNISSAIWVELEEEGLVGVKYGSGFRDIDFLTALGKTVLAQGDQPPAEAAPTVAGEAAWDRVVSMTDDEIDAENGDTRMKELRAENERLTTELAAARIALKACVKVLELGVLPSTNPSLRDFESASEYDRALEVWNVVGNADIAVEVWATANLKAQP